MTERLYYRDARLMEFDATVVEHAGDAQHVVLDRTAFYPTSGGQPHDTGRLGTARVVDVTEAGDRIIHVVDSPLSVGAIHGSVDGARRLDHMQQHSAQHLLSAIAADRFGWETVSVHFGSDHSAIEFAVPAVTASQLRELERCANEVVADARPVTVSFESADAAARAGLRKPSGRTGEVRVITVESLDRSACGGTHVTRTSEIGSVLVLADERIRGHVRVGFLAGDRVALHARRGDATLAAVARQLGCAINEIEPLVAARQADLKQAREYASKLEQEVATKRVRELFATILPDADGIRRVTHRAGDESPTLLRLMAQAVAPLERALFVAIVPAPPTVYFGASADSTINAGAILKTALAEVAGRGGGSERVAQGTVPSPDALEQLGAAIIAQSNSTK
jgi:alanyl-tRNA synthetase